MNVEEVDQILGSCSEFYAQQTRRLLNLGMDIRDRAVSYLAYRTETLAEYLESRQQLEPFCSPNMHSGVPPPNIRCSGRAAHATELYR